MSDRTGTVRYCLVTTLDRNLNYFYAGVLPLLLERGIEVHGVSSPGVEHERLRQNGMHVHGIRIPRKPSPFPDLVSMLRLLRFFLTERFDLIVVSTPKAALLATLAATFSGQRRRVVYVVRGRAYENATGWRRRAMVGLDGLVCRLAMGVVPIGKDLQESLVAEHICPADKVSLFAHGSSKGVDVAQFSRDRAGMDRESAREVLGIPSSATLVGYVGWLRAEKGTGELIEAVASLRSRHESLHLLLVGTFEDERDPIPAAARALAAQADWIHVVPWMSDPATGYAAMDIFAFPTYREGFGNVALEAASMHLPVVASAIPGVREAVEFGVTALATRPKDVRGLADALGRLVDDRRLRETLGHAGRCRVVAGFRREYVLDEFTNLLDQYAGRPR